MLRTVGAGADACPSAGVGDTAHVDPGQIAELRRWARQLQETGGSEEARAAARAILLLVDEIERLRGEGEERAEEAQEEPPREEEPPGPEPPAGGGLGARLRRTFRRPGSRTVQPAAKIAGADPH